MTQIRDRIRELRRVPATELRANPRNYRTHPEPQRAALRGILAEVGLADALLAYDTPDGLTLVDGHLRLEECGDQVLPVLVLDVTEAEADKLLVTLDPLAAMAEADASKLDALLRDVQTAAPALADMFTELAEEAGLLDSKADDVKQDEVPEPPLGSGTTLIAAEQLGRKCYGIELSPQYCDVVVKRWETLTGQKAVRG